MSLLEFCGLCDLWDFECHCSPWVPSVCVASGLLGSFLVSGVPSIAWTLIKHKSTAKVGQDVEPRGEVMLGAVAREL